MTVEEMDEAELRRRLRQIDLEQAKLHRQIERLDLAKADLYERLVDVLNQKGEGEVEEPEDLFPF
jgi:prefoldin subunit 5